LKLNFQTRIARIRRERNKKALLKICDADRRTFIMFAADSASLL
jgi:hypothetical protein